MSSTWSVYEFEFDLCDRLGDPNLHNSQNTTAQPSQAVRFVPLFVSPVTQECLDEHLLTDMYGNTDHYMGETNADYSYRLRLPAGLTCTQCVLQWKYNAGQ